MPIEIVSGTGPDVEPVTLSEAKDHLRVTGSADDSWITRAIKSIRQTGETYTRRAWITRDVDITIDRFPTWRDREHDRIVLPVGRVSAVASVTYTKEDGSTAVMDAADYFLAHRTGHTRLVLQRNSSWPTATLRPANAVTIRCTAGYGTSPNDLPGPLIDGLLLSLAASYDYRSDHYVEPGVVAVRNPEAARIKWFPYRAD